MRVGTIATTALSSVVAYRAAIRCSSDDITEYLRYVDERQQERKGKKEEARGLEDLAERWRWLHQSDIAMLFKRFALQDI